MSEKFDSFIQNLPSEVVLITDKQIDRRIDVLRESISGATTNTGNSKLDSKTLSLAMRDIVESKINELGQHLEDKLEIVLIDKILTGSEFNIGVGAIIKN